MKIFFHDVQSFVNKYQGKNEKVATFTKDKSSFDRKRQKIAILLSLIQL